MARSYRRSTSTTEDLQILSKKIRLISESQVKQLNNLNKFLSLSCKAQEIVDERVAIRCELKRKLDHLQQQIDFKRLELDAIDGGRFAQGTGVQLQQSIDALVQDLPDPPDASFPRQPSLSRWMPEAGRKCLRDAPSCTSNSQPKRSFAESNCAGPVEHQGLIASEGSKGVRKHVLFCSGELVWCKACGFYRNTHWGPKTHSLAESACKSFAQGNDRKMRLRRLLNGLHPTTLEPLPQAVPWQ